MKLAERQSGFAFQDPVLRVETEDAVEGASLLHGRPRAEAGRSIGIAAPADRSRRVRRELPDLAVPIGASDGFTAANRAVEAHEPSRFDGGPFPRSAGSRFRRDRGRERSRPSIPRHSASLRIPALDEVRGSCALAPGGEESEVNSRNSRRLGMRAYFRPTRNMPATIRSVPIQRFGPTVSPRMTADAARRKTK